MCETKKCNRCGEEKPLSEFHHDKFGNKKNPCISCKKIYMTERREGMKNGTWKPENSPTFVFDYILAMWVLTHARKPNTGPLNVINAYSCAGVRSIDSDVFGGDEYHVVYGKEIERCTTPLFGNPTGVSYVLS